MALRSSTRPSRSQRLLLVSNVDAGAQTLGPFAAFRGTLARNWIRSGESRTWAGARTGCWRSKWWLYLLLCSISLLNSIPVKMWLVWAPAVRSMLQVRTQPPGALYCNPGSHHLFTGCSVWLVNTPPPPPRLSQAAGILGYVFLWHQRI